MYWFVTKFQLKQLKNSKNVRLKMTLSCNPNMFPASLNLKAVFKRQTKVHFSGKRLN
jgi:hypothetical protein